MTHQPQRITGQMTFIIPGEIETQVTVVENPDGTIGFTITMLETGGQIADLGGFFFDLGLDPSLNDNLMITDTSADANITAFEVQEAKVGNLSDGVNLNGSAIAETGKFDVGVKFGVAGIGGGDDISEGSFTLTLYDDTGALVPLTLNDLALTDLGVRYTSVGAEGGAREASLKITSQIEGPAGSAQGFTLYGYSQADEGAPSGGHDTLIGGEGDDTIFGYSGNDMLYGNGGNDTIYTGGWADSAWGGDGDDTLIGEGGGNTMYGEAGDDFIDGGKGFLGSSRDIAVFSGNLADYTITEIAPSSYPDSATYLVVDNRPGSPDGADTVINVEVLRFADQDFVLVADDENYTVYGTDGADVFDTGKGDQIVFAGGGDDIIKGGNGDDTLYGEDGNDTIIGGSNEDILIGGAGDDIISGGSGDGGDIAVYSGSSSDFTVVDNLDGTWTVTDNNALDGDEGVDTVDTVEILRFDDMDMIL